MSNTIAQPINTEFAAWPQFDSEEMMAVSDVLASGKINYWTGNQGKIFEKLFADTIGTQHAMTISNGTVALELALKALGVGPGDEVIVTSRTFMASASAVVWLGAKPVFADIDPKSGNITCETIEPLVTEFTKVIIAVHLAGWPCDMDPIMDLARVKGLRVIEDCAQAHGAKYKNRSVGSIGDIGAWSFCQDKIISTGGEGGMLTMNDHALWSACWSLRDHGKSFDAVHRTAHPAGYRWVHESFGTNARLTEMQSILGIFGLKKLPKTLSKRTQNAARLSARFSDIVALRVEIPEDHKVHAYYKYYCYVKPETLRKNWNRDRIINEINAQGVPCFSGSCSELYQEKAFLKAGYVPKERLPKAKALGESSLMFLVHPTLSSEAIERTAEVVTQVCRNATA
jgi:dTDP-4-amino-4,6-dideoxygalactose transaminase